MASVTDECFSELQYGRVSFSLYTYERAINIFFAIKMLFKAKKCALASLPVLHRYNPKGLMQ
jgi:hypothetical protein